MSIKDQVLVELNKFCIQPKSIEKRLQTFHLGLSLL